ncbi:MAG: hypothetical protein V4864_16035 [Pseudomonadota bacterium]
MENTSNNARYQIIKVRHFGAAFIDNENARLLCSGMFHHYVVLLL